uniref:Protein kinase domain-containing protein n=1 Tax=Tetradesmus obliquus TaxID=3088 RepID=A0A383VY47_TETOB|eukprot:jgi/Sobl393_1/7157/SZX69684.1
MEHLEIVRPLACSHSCFVSIVKVPDANSSTNQLAGSTAEPAGDAAAPTATASAAASSSGPSCKQGVAKSYRKAKLDEDETRQVELEIKLHRQLSALSPHVVPFWAALDSRDSTTILTAHCKGDLRSTLEQAGGALSEATVREQVAAPLLEVLVHMHRLGFVHRDIKPENVFVSGKQAMLGDFGLAIAMPSKAAADSSSDAISSPRCSSSRLTAGGDSSSASTSRHAPLLRSCASTSSLRIIPGASAGTAGDSSNSCGSGQQHGAKVAVIRRSSSCGAVGGFDCSVMPQLKQLQAGGTPAYTAPEVVQATFNNTPLEAAVGPQNDVWNLGVLVWEALAGRHPFGDHTTSPGAFMCAVVSRSQGQIAAGIAALPVSDACKDWLGLALQKDPSKRAAAAQLQQHCWLVPAAAAEAQQQQQQVSQPASHQQLSVECSAASALLQCCTSDDFSAAAAAAAAAAGAASMATVHTHSAHNSSSSSFSAGTCSSDWQTAAAAAAAGSTQSGSSCGTAAGRLASGTGSVSSCSATGGISAMSQQQFASYLQTIGSWED